MNGVFERENRFFPLIIIVLSFLLISEIVAVKDALVRNFGVVLVIHALHKDSEESVNEIIYSAWDLLTETRITSDQDFAWRGLGFALMQHSQEEDAVQAWQIAGGMSDEFAENGNRAWGRNQYKNALAWYSLALEVDQNTNLDWLKVGQSCQLLTADARTGACGAFLAHNEDNWFIDADFRQSSSSIHTWRFTYPDQAVHDVVSCPSHSDRNCAQIEVDGVNLESGASWHQCLRLDERYHYRFSAWIKAEVADQARWRPLYFQGKIGGEYQGFSYSGYQAGSTDWQYWQWIFTPPDFDEDSACFHPVRLHGDGKVWFFDPRLTIVEES